MPKSKETWAERAEEVRRRIAVSQGIWPTPEKTPLNAVVHGKVDRGDYTVEKVFFESVPGFFVTGNLYRPKHQTGKQPGVLFAARALERRAVSSTSAGWRCGRRS